MSRNPLENSLSSQVNSVLTFLSSAGHQVEEAYLRALCPVLPSDHKLAARQLKSSLASVGVHIKHTHALKAVTQMRGAGGYLGSAEAIRWEIASWQDEGPTVSARRRIYSNFGKACDEVCSRLREQFEPGDSPFVRLEMSANLVELSTVGEPNPGWRALIVADTPPLPYPALDLETRRRLGERLRRLIEGELGGWLDGVVDRHIVEESHALGVLVGNDLIPVQFESEILAILAEAEPNSDHWASAEKSAELTGASLGVVRILKNGATTPVSAPMLNTLLTRYRFFVDRHDEGFAEWGKHRVDSSKRERFAPESLNVQVVDAALSAKGLDDTAVASAIGIGLAEWLSCRANQALPVRLFRPLRDVLSLAAENLLLGEAQPTARIPLPRHEDISMFVSRMEAIEILNVEQELDLAARLRRLVATPFEERRHWYKRPPSELKAINQELRFEGLVACATVEKQFIADLPLDRSRYGIVLVISLEKEIDVLTQDGRLHIDNTVTTMPDEDDVDPITPDWLDRFNKPEFTGEDLLEYAEKVEQMRDPEGDDDDHFHNTMHAAVRVFKGVPGKAHAATVRMEAVSRMLRRDSLEPWVLRSMDTGASMLSRPVFEAAARCPLIDVAGRPGFDSNTFRRMVIEYSRTWEVNRRVAP